MIRQEFTGMLPAAIVKFEELLANVAKLNPKILKGYDSAAEKDSYAYWGCACIIICDDMDILKEQAATSDITWLTDDGLMAYTNSLTIDDFKTYRVNGNLELTTEQEV